MLCLIAKLEAEATESLRALRRAALAPEPDPRPLHGHITLATYLGPEEAFLRFGREELAGVPAFSVRYERLAVLEETSVLVALPAREGTLEALHRQVLARFGEELDRWTGSEVWLPHTSLLYDPEADLQALCRRLSAGFRPLTARVCALEFSRVLPDGYEILESLALSD